MWKDLTEPESPGGHSKSPSYSHSLRLSVSFSVPHGCPLGAEHGRRNGWGSLTDGLVGRFPWLQARKKRKRSHLAVVWWDDVSCPSPTTPTTHGNMPTTPPTVIQTTGSRTTSTATVNDNTCSSNWKESGFQINYRKYLSNTELPIGDHSYSSTRS